MGSRFPHKISTNFIHFYPLEKPNVSPVWCAPPPPFRWPSFEHSGTKMGSLDIQLCTQDCVPVSHLHVPPQNSTSTRFSTVWEVPDANTYSQDCTARQKMIKDIVRKIALHRRSLTVLLDEENRDCIIEDDELHFLLVCRSCITRFVASPGALVGSTHLRPHMLLALCAVHDNGLPVRQSGQWQPVSGGIYKAIQRVLSAKCVFG